MNPTPLIVCLCAQEDFDLARALQRHLAPVRQRMRFWYPEQILAGSGRSSEIDAQLRDAALVLVLYSASFYADQQALSERLQQVPAERLLSIRARALTVPPDHALHQTQLLPRDNHPLAPRSDQEGAYADLTKEILQALERVNPPAGTESGAISSSPAPQEPSRRRRADDSFPQPVFVGRDEELQAMEAALLPASGAVRAVALCALQGMPGVGKSYLADRFATLHASRFPGGYRRLVLAPSDPRSATQLREEIGTALGLKGQLTAELVRQQLYAARVLYHIENVDSRPLAGEVARLVHELRECPLIVTGRVPGLGIDAGWAEIEVQWFSTDLALEQLRHEHRAPKDDAEAVAQRQLVEALGGLPLAIHIAAAHLREGHTVAGFLRLLQRRGLDVAPGPSSSAMMRDQARAGLRSTFALSLELLRQTLGEGNHQGFMALAHGPPGGAGRSLGAALAGLDTDAFEEVLVAARRLSLLQSVSDRADAWRLHPLLAELLRSEMDPTPIIERMTTWFVSRVSVLPDGQEAEQGQRWQEVQEEGEALRFWLALVPALAVPHVNRAGSWFAMLVGPFATWVSLCERGLAAKPKDQERSHLLWTLCQVAHRAGDLDRALSAANEKVTLDRQRGRSHGVALAMGKIADVLQARGQIDEALRIRREEELPIYDKLGDIRERAVALGKIADILQSRGQFDEALRIRREEELPVFDKLGDLHCRAGTLGRIADILHMRGQLDEALHIRRMDVLPIYEELGDIHSRAMTLEKIAAVRHAQGYLDEALRIIREESLPVYEKLGAQKDLLVGQANLAIIYLCRAQPGDREAAKEQLEKAAASAIALNLSIEAKQIQGIQKSAGFIVPLMSE